jgi:hypothetical protein
MISERPATDHERPYPATSRLSATRYYVRHVYSEESYASSLRCPPGI